MCPALGQARHILDRPQLPNNRGHRRGRGEDGDEQQNPRILVFEPRVIANGIARGAHHHRQYERQEAPASRVPRHESPRRLAQAGGGQDEVRDDHDRGADIEARPPPYRPRVPELEIDGRACRRKGREGSSMLALVTGACLARPVSGGQGWAPRAGARTPSPPLAGRWYGSSQVSRRERRRLLLPGAHSHDPQVSQTGLRAHGVHAPRVESARRRPRHGR